MTPTLLLQKQRLSIALYIASILLFTGSGAIALWQDWFRTRVADLPPSFWILYAANIITVISITLYLRYYTETPINLTRQTHPITASMFVFLGIVQLGNIFTAPNPTGSAIFLGTFGAAFILIYGSVLIRYILTRLNNQKPRNNRPSSTNSHTN